MKDDTPELIGELIRRRRQELRLSPMELARRSGLDAAIISRTEAGSRIPSPDTLAALAVALELPLTELYEVAGYPVPSLPPLRPYLRRAYDLPDEAIAEVQRYVDEVSQRYGNGPTCPAPGEDEQPE